MRISKQWLEEFVALPKNTPEEMAEALTVQTVEVEDALEQGAGLGDVVVGEILEVKKHPDADKLNIAQVDVGEKQPRQIVFGQMLEMQVGYKIPVALAPTVLPGDKAINKTKMRGEVSEGMLCLDQELGLVNGGVSIQFFGPEVPNGTKIIDALGLDDVIFDIDNKSMTHRPDLWGHYGMAREFAALYKTTLKPYAPAAIKEGNVPLSVEVKEPDLCPRYMGVLLEGITIAPSPQWMQKRLLAVGVRPINNIVDITNYVMFELGQPMHAFDATRIEKNTIVVRKAKQGEQITLLGGEVCELGSDMLVIADAQRAVAVAGVKGENDSGVTDETTRIIFEAANFHALSVRKTASTLGIRTDASARFEKGLDPNLPELALRRAVELTCELCPGASVVSTVADEASFSLNRGPIFISADRIRARIGVALSTTDIVDMLSRIGFEVATSGDELSITVPTWRATGDIAIPEDIIEEVARMYGYGNIPTTFPLFPIAPPPPSTERDLKKRVKELVAYEAGYTEIYNYSFVSPEWLGLLGIGVDDHIELAHPLAKDKPFVRRSLIPNMLESVEMNLHRVDAVRLFETGRGYKKEDEGPVAVPGKKELLPGQDDYLGMVYAEKGVDVPFFELSAVVHGLFDRLGVTLRMEAAEETVPSLHGGRQAKIVVENECVGRLAEVHPRVQEKIGIPYRTAILELNLTALSAHVGERIAYTPLPQFPVVERDLAFRVEKAVRHADIIETIQSADPLVRSVSLFDVYEGEHVSDNEKSLAYTIIYRADDRTLTTEEAEAAHRAVLAALQKKHGAEIRS